jgi:hypothetical protein
MSEGRNKSHGPVFQCFRGLSELPPEERATALMERLEYVWQLAEARSYTSNKGNVHHMPDTAVMLKVVQAVAVLQGLTGQASEAEQEQLARMTDADLVREATKRLPPAQVAELADTLIRQREAQRDGQAIVTKAESAPHDQTKPSRKRRHAKPGAPGAAATESDGASAPDADPKWA